MNIEPLSRRNLSEAGSNVQHVSWHSICEARSNVECQKMKNRHVIWEKVCSN